MSPDTPEPLTVEQSRPNLGFAVLAVVKYQRRCGMLRVEPDLSHEVYAAYEKALDTLIAAARRDGAQQMRERATSYVAQSAINFVGPDGGQPVFFAIGDRMRFMASYIASLPLETP
jgi:hypothetical protein